MKKSDFISFRTTKETKDELQTIADEKRWSISQTCEILIKEQLKDKLNILYESVLDIVGEQLQFGHISEEAANALEQKIIKAYEEVNKE